MAKKLTLALAVLAALSAQAVAGCSSPTPDVQEVERPAAVAVLQPTTMPSPDVKATELALALAVESTLTALAPTNTPSPPPTSTAYPTYTPYPTYTQYPTLTPRPTYTMVGPSATSTSEPSRTPTRRPPATTAPSQRPAVSYPPPVLLTPPLGYNVFFFGGCRFTWTWGSGSLKQDEYFQVQIIGPGDQHRGIHPPTKGYSFESDAFLYGIFTDWFDKRKYATAKWTVAVIQWDGEDPSKIGATLVEAEWRDITL